MLNNLLLGQTAEDKLYVEDVFSTWLFDGAGSTVQTITNGIDLAGKGGMVWTKFRNSAFADHRIVDTVRGAGNRLETSNTNANSFTTENVPQSFTSSGFTWKDNASGLNVASWTFRKAPKFFDVVTYTGTGSARTINHSLGVEPGMIWVKNVSQTGPWTVYHRSLGATKFLTISTSAENTASTIWNNTAPTSTEFSVGTDLDMNRSGNTYVAYLFAHDTTADGVIQCGSFTTDGSGYATVNLGWEPQFILSKRTDSSTGGDWWLFDDMRGWPTGSNEARLLANTSGAETSGSNYGNPTSTGFVWAAAASASYIYLAIRRGPMRVPTDATKVFKPSLPGNLAAAGTVAGTGDFPVDLLMQTAKSSAQGFYSHARLVGMNFLYTPGTDTEFSAATSDWGYLVQNGVGYGAARDFTGKIFLAFRRSPGFFDVVCYTGTGSARTVSHNLGVAPELMIVKNRSTADYWMVYSAATGNSQFMKLNDVNAAGGTSNWNNTTPTSTVFSVGAGATVNGSGNNMVAYLFATCPGVSKVGTYTGTGTTQQINCGFTNGARFVLIKRTDSTGDWYVWDTARGIVSGNDPYLLLNSTAAEVTNTDYIDPLSTGFEISSTAPAAINANGGTFVFLAIA